MKKGVTHGRPIDLSRNGFLFVTRSLAVRRYKYNLMWDRRECERLEMEVMGIKKTQCQPGQRSVNLRPTQEKPTKCKPAIDSGWVRRKPQQAYLGNMARLHLRLRCHSLLDHHLRVELSTNRRTDLFRSNWEILSIVL